VAQQPKRPKYTIFNQRYQRTNNEVGNNLVRRSTNCFDTQRN